MDLLVAMLEPTGNAVQIVAEIPVNVSLELRSLSIVLVSTTCRMRWLFSVYFTEYLIRLIRLMNRYLQKSCRWIEN